ADPTVAALQRQLDETAAAVARLNDQLAQTSNPDTRAAIRDELSGLRASIETIETTLGAVGGSSEVAALLEEQDSLISRRATLLERRDEISIDSELAPNTVALFSPAQFATASSSLSLGRASAMGLVVGLIGGGGIAYLLASRKRSFGSRSEPELVLGAPLLADVPEFAEEGFAGSLPVRDAPRSAAAEAYRFAATSLELKMRSGEARSVAVVSSTLGHGKTTTVANTAIASAREGKRVLVVDADFGNQTLTTLLTGVGATQFLGLTDVVEAGLPLDRAIKTIHLGNEVKVGLLSRGQQPAIAADLLRSPAAQELFRDLAGLYDLVLVDVPPILQVAYASILVEYMDEALAIVRHGSPLSEVEDLAGRLRFIDTPLIGYVYNRSQLRREMTTSEGSMRDILGDQGTIVTPMQRGNARRRLDRRG
ncbi:MAG: AAA family ATPase, partial [Acidimicrobiia bacterium]